MSDKEELIGKVKLDLTYCNEQEDAAESIPGELLEIVKTQDRKAYGKVILEHKSWPFLYHLSPFRENIIAWYPIAKTAKVLEIGSECGAHTSVLCEKAGTVHAVDSSYKACLINAHRNKDADNLTVFACDPITFIKNSIEKYDIITLIGGVSYTEELLGELKTILAPGGKILITVNNRIGLRYLAGYEDTSGGVRLTRKELIASVEKQGFKDYSLYYPYPDACLTDVIYSDDRLPGKGDLNENIRNFDKERFVFFDEAKTYDDITEEGDFGAFSNSFFMAIGEDTDEKIIYAKISDSRDFRFQIITELYKTKTGISVRKINKLSEGYEWIKNTKSNEEKLNKAFQGKVKICPSTLTDSYLEFDYIEGEGMDKELKKACASGKKEEIISVLDKYYEIIRCMKTNDKFEATEKFKSIFGKPSIQEDSESGDIVNVDLVFPNIIKSNGEDTIIDYEWVFDFPIPLEFVFWRGLNYSKEIAELDGKIRDDVYAHYGLTEEKVSIYRDMEDSFQRYVYGDMVRLYDYSRVIPLLVHDTNELEIRIHELEDHTTYLESHTANLEKHIEGLTNELTNIRSSKSWKILKFFKIVQ